MSDMTRRQTEREPHSTPSQQEETTADERASYRTSPDDKSYFSRRLVRDYDRLEAERDTLCAELTAVRDALAEVLSGCVSGSHVGSRNSTGCRACKRARQALTEAGSTQL